MPKGRASYGGGHYSGGSYQQQRKKETRKRIIMIVGAIILVGVVVWLAIFFGAVNPGMGNAVQQSVQEVTQLKIQLKEKDDEIESLKQEISALHEDLASRPTPTPTPILPPNDQVGAGQGTPEPTYQPRARTQRTPKPTESPKKNPSSGAQTQPPQTPPPSTQPPSPPVQEPAEPVQGEE